MKKIALAALFAVFGTAAHADVFNVEINNSCTKFYVNVEKFVASGVRYGCAGEAIEGGAVARLDHKRGVILSESYMGYIVTWFFTTPEAGAGKVYVTISNGEEVEEVAATTYEILRNPPPSGSPQSSGPDFMKSLDFSKLKPGR
ncbi:MAG TPA: hypothetical protein VMF58_02395 [Rhizomicrobium sp.]|nr:hypothetical protein [Rhizomicrobium sp.]